MAEHSTIEWTDATWNPITGCSVVSPGCTNCYAMRLAGTRLKHIPSRKGLTRDSKAGPVWTGEVRLNSEWLDQPLRWKKPGRIFVCAHGDLFAEGVPDEWIDQVFAVMALAPQHTFQVLTKRAARMREYITARLNNSRLRLQIVGTMNMMGAGATRPIGYRMWPLPNVWLGVSTEDQQRADERVPELLATPAAIRFVSAEPLLGPIQFDDFCNGYKFIDALRGNWWHDNPDGPNPISRGHEKLDWIIAGGESGKDARPMHPDWPRQIRDQCTEAGTAFFFKQWGAWQIAEEIEQAEGIPHHWRFPDGDEFHIVSDGHDIIMCEAQDSRTPKRIWRDYWADGHGNLAKRCGKKTAGRLLDGVEHNGMPEIREVPFS
ncbi:phage Gp37/Gp68 family protein [Pseudaminobacter arsenicus]|uniref:Phage Gp37/Gp68 family protein n=1 Tax=Borborobacter arsenicus TaxID=1851146 RepID=A0A432V725_9HYPH|nr:phage Gp37/Gp68 family protein [Pseudaminobacter arsenicus]RUM97883.1 phage Gp37/Gp68 family protein [Pseudaminobacter arsenicus]